MEIFIKYRFETRLTQFYCQKCKDDGYLIEVVKDTDLFDDATCRCGICGNDKFIKVKAD